MTLGLLAGFYMAWSIGANDVANAMGTSVGSKGITIKQAVIIAAIMEFLGAVLVGSHVSETVRKGMFDPSVFEPLPLVLGFIAALLAAAVWLQVATFYGWPVSTTHTLVGAVLGVGLARGVQFLNLRIIRDIALSWIITIPAGALLAIGFYYLLAIFFKGG